MFRVDESFEIHIPPALRQVTSDDACRYYGIVDLVGNRPLWLVHALTHRGTTAGRWKRLLFSRMEDVLQTLASPGWDERHLYVLAPQYLTGMDTITLLSCTSVERCMEPDNDNICWRVQTSHGALLDSTFGTEAGSERHACVVWSQAG
jgi:hypothetical protein